MSSGGDVVAGPEVDMAELYAASSGPVAVDLNLNLGPSFALELALGGQDVEESVPISRPNWNWPRFEPGILAGGQEDEVPPMAEEVLAEDQTEIDDNVLTDLNWFSSGNNSRVVSGDLNQSGYEPEADVERSLAGHRTFRSNLPRTWYLRLQRLAASPPTQFQLQSQDSSEHGSTSETRAVTAIDTAVSLLLPNTNENEQNPSNTVFDVSTSHDPSVLQGKAESGGIVGASFECNVCLEIATEPVVTCCGHLFCWPCIYKWLHLHSSQKECPVCKGFLSDDAITPIYGRGMSRVAENIVGDIPPRPHAHRVNGKRRWLDRFIGERVEQGAAVGESLPPIDRRHGETSNAAEVVLNRLRVAQRLQREYFDDRLRMIHLHHVGRHVREALLPRAIAAFGTSSQASSTSLTPSLDQHHTEDIPVRIPGNRLVTANSLAAIGASMDGLREGLEHMQRTLEIVSTLPSQTGMPSPRRAGDTGSSSVVWPLVNEARIPPSSEANPSSHATNAELRIESPEFPQTSRHRAVHDTAGSSDLEPGSLHSRKRRRLN